MELVCCETERKPESAATALRQCPKCARRYPQYATFCGVDGASLDGNGGSVGVPRSETMAGDSPDFKQKTATISQAQVEIAKDEALIQTDDEGEPVLSGEVLDGKYRIDQALAQGGMAILYLAHQINMDRTVIVKVMHSSLMHRKDAIERFKRESKLVARLQHPNIVAVYDFGFKNGKQPFLVMEYIRGGSLAQKLESGTLDLPTAGRIMLQMCSGLEEAHQQGIIHRDLKPDNILLQDKVERPDWVKIVDFGIAHLIDSNPKNRLTRAGIVIGTPEYMAPEQFTGKALDERTDIYALGLIYFEMLAGGVPFQSDEYELLMARRLMEQAPPISDFRKDVVPGSGIDQVIAKCLTHDPNQRFQSVGEMRKAVNQALAEI